MDERSRTRLSKFLSYVLRHKPEAIRLELDAEGWADVDTLLRLSREDGKEIARAELEEVVATSPKQRFALSGDGLRIRANQGHSAKVDLGYEPTTPPEMLFHGTVARNLGAIRARGLVRMKRHHVHLSMDRDTAAKVGQRRGEPLVLTVRAGDMHRAGFAFFVSENGVWLTEHVPSRFLEIPDADHS